MRLEREPNVNQRGSRKSARCEGAAFKMLVNNLDQYEDIQILKPSLQNSFQGCDQGRFKPHFGFGSMANGLKT